MKDKMGGACSSHGTDDKRVKNFTWEIRKEETT